MKKIKSSDFLLGLTSPLTINQHNGCAAIVSHGKTLSCCEEERYTRDKHALGKLPVNAISAALKINNISMRMIKAVFVSSASHPDLKKRVELYLKHYFGHSPDLHMIDHQLSHLASAYYPSGFSESMLLSIDGFGDFKSMASAIGKNGKIEILETKDISQSLGIFYQVMTQFLGFNGAGDEYKLMGLSAYGKPGVDLSSIIKISNNDYSINADYLKRDISLKNMFEPRYGPKLIELFGQPRRKGEPLSDHHKDIAFAVQDSFEKAVITIVKRMYQKTKLRNLCMAGGCALNCVTNMKLLNLDFIDNLYVQPAATDQGLALGAILYGSSEAGIKPKKIPNYYLGSEYSNENIKSALELSGAKYFQLNNKDISKLASESLKNGKIIALYQGRSEFGPRALGNRSILANAIIPDIKDQINKRIKFREEFRPFAPAVLAESANKIFSINQPSPFMTITSNVKKEWRNKIPGIVHVDGTARIQTVDEEQNKIFYSILKEFEKKTGIPVLVNTSFNIKGEPIVETPLDAIRTFYSCGLDELYIGNFRITKQ